jgi:hypothetical protein
VEVASSDGANGKTGKLAPRIHGALGRVSKQPYAAAATFKRKCTSGKTAGQSKFRLSCNLSMQELSGSKRCVEMQRDIYV